MVEGKNEPDLVDGVAENDAGQHDGAQDEQDFGLGLGRDVAVAHRDHGDHGPVEAHHVADRPGLVEEAVTLDPRVLIQRVPLRIARSARRSC